MSDVLFNLPIDNPHLPVMDGPTPDDAVAALTPAEREARLRLLIAQAHQIVDDAIATHGGGLIVGSALLFSGGGDSTILAHLMRDRVDTAIHANTGIGIESTRQFVRDTCATWGLPLIEKHATGNNTYRALVLDQGFPGTGHHFKMYQRLKDRQLRKATADMKRGHSRNSRVLFIAGRRRVESDRRKTIPLHERVGVVVWASPLANWTALDMSTYRTLFPDTPGPCLASATLHMSGECLCGAFAAPGELDEIGYWFPEVRAEIEALEAEVRAAGIPEPFCRWGHGEGKPSESGPLCSSCSTRQLSLVSATGTETQE